MSTMLTNQLEDSFRVPVAETKMAVTNFAKDTPKMTKYTLVDNADGMDGDTNYHFQIVTKEDEHRVMKFLKRFFFRDEPLNYAIGLIPEGENSTCVELEEYCSNSSLENNLSLMAVSTSGAIVGVILNGKSEPSKEEEPDYITNCKNLKFQKILKLLHYVDRMVNVDDKFEEQDVLEVRIISVDSNWRGKGIAKALLEKTIEIAEERKFNTVRVDCTSVFSGKLCEKLGFESIYELNYSDYVDDNGEPIFTPAYPHTNVSSYIKKL